MKPSLYKASYSFRNSDTAFKLIAICVGVFLVYTLVDLVFHKPQLLNGLVVQNDWQHSLQKPWSFLTYAFVHPGFIGLLFNMVFLYFSAQLFYTFFSQRSLLALFFVGASAGSLSFQLVTFISPLTHTLTGASAGIYALLTAVCTYQPRFEVYLFGLLRLKLIYILATLIGLNLIYLLSGVNTGGEIAHFGAMTAGFFYTRGVLLRGKSLSDWVPLRLSALWPWKKKKHSAKRSIVKALAQKRKSEVETQLDKILEKISRSGYKSLSKREKQFLKKASEELNANNPADGTPDSDA